MLARIRKAMDEKDEGFTLIELLVVIIIIGILAAIAIPVFLNQRQKGYDAQVKSDVKNASTAEETYFTDYNGYIPAASLAAAVTALGTYGWKNSAGDTAFSVTLAGTAPNQTYTILGTSSSGNQFCYNSAASGNGVVKGATC